MLFNSLTFVAFFVTVLALYWGMRSWKARKNLLLVASYIFYGAWNPPFAALLFSTTALDFYLGHKMGKIHNPHERRVWLWISVAVRPFTRQSPQTLGALVHAAAAAGLHSD